MYYILHNPCSRSSMDIIQMQPVLGNFVARNYQTQLYRLIIKSTLSLQLMLVYMAKDFSEIILLWMWNAVELLKAQIAL